MSEQTDPTHDPGDFGRRIARRRERLGLDLHEAAARAGMDPVYLEYVETHPAQPNSAVVVRLAAALETTAYDLVGGGVDLPPGHEGDPEPAARLEALTTDECHALLASGGVGRLVFYDARGPVAVPVNFKMSGTSVVFRTAALSSIRGGLDRGRVGFEVDHLDEAMRQGWSVLISGYAREIRDDDERAALDELEVSPWTGGERPLYVRVEPVVITGRRIVVDPTVGTSNAN